MSTSFLAAAVAIFVQEPADLDVVVFVVGLDAVQHEPALAAANEIVPDVGAGDGGYGFVHGSGLAFANGDRVAPGLLEPGRIR